MANSNEILKIAFHLFCSAALSNMLRVGVGCGWGRRFSQQLAQFPFSSQDLCLYLISKTDAGFLFIQLITLLSFFCAFLATKTSIHELILE